MQKVPGLYVQKALGLCCAALLVTGCVPDEEPIGTPVLPRKTESTKREMSTIVEPSILKKVVKNQTNDPDALVSLAEKYYNGIGVSQDIVKALAYFIRAAELGSGYACRRLGMEYSDFAFDDKTPRDDAKARAWLEKGAKLGDPESTYYLSEFVYEGRGGPKDTARASQLLIQAAHLKCQLAAHRALKLQHKGTISFSIEDKKEFFVLDRQLKLNDLAR
jgi:hypothetical protein